MCVCVRVRMCVRVRVYVCVCVYVNDTHRTQKARAATIHAPQTAANAQV